MLAGLGDDVDVHATGSIWPGKGVSPVSYLLGLSKGEHLPRCHELAVPGSGGDVVEDNMLVNAVELDVVGEGDGLGDVEVLDVFGRVGLHDIRLCLDELTKDGGIVCDTGGWRRMGGHGLGQGGHLGLGGSRSCNAQEAKEEDEDRCAMHCCLCCALMLKLWN